MLTILKTLGIIMALENTVNVNVILNGMRHIPIIGKYIPEKIYSVKIFKIYATFLSINYELVKAFFVKLGLFAIVFFFAAVATNFKENSSACAYVFVFLVASFVIMTGFNAFKITTAAEYAIFHLGMDAKKYVQANLFYQLSSFILGAVIFGIPTAIIAGVQWYIAILIPFALAGFITISVLIKMAFYAWKKKVFQKEEKKLSRGKVEGGMVFYFIVLFILFTAAFVGTPFLVYYDLYFVGVIIVVIAGLSFVPGIFLINRFPYLVYRNIISKERERDVIVKEINKRYNHGNKQVSVNKSAGIKDEIKGYKYLNELFLKRHKKTLIFRFFWIALLTLVGLFLVSMYMRVELMHTSDQSKMLMRFFFISHPAFYPFILLFTNFGMMMSEVMYKNCDSTFLKFGFYRQPDALRKMYRLRVASVIKYNIPLTAVIAIYSIAVVILTGGEDYFFESILNIIIIFAAMIFYSVRYMTLHYLLQPFEEKVKNLKAVLYYTFPVVSLIFWIILIVAKVPAFVIAPFFVLLTAIYYYVSDKMVYKFAKRLFK